MTRRLRLLRRFLALAASLVALAGPAAAATVEPGEGGRPAAPAGGETVEQALCRLIESSARASGIPVSFLTRLIWRESSFRAGVVSPAGAQGVAQFMPGTARERGLADPFDPEQAIPAAARLLADHRRQFGNLGLAAAAYNGGPRRVTDWLAGGGLPMETRTYVAVITGRSVDDWAAEARAGTAAPAAPEQACLQVTAALRVRVRGEPVLAALEGPLSPWGVQLSGNFSKALALNAFARTRDRYASLLGGVTPMVIGTRLRHRGTRAFYRVRVGAGTRGDAERLCGRIRAVGGACLVLRT
jgi:hypothetical protein